jgi:hypothetical protein
MIEKAIKIILAILFFICLAELPYGYYQFVRFAALIGFAFLSYQSYERNDKSFAFIFAALAILFQPLIKISLGREVWNVVDVVVGIGLLISLFFDKKQNS